MRKNTWRVDRKTTYCHKCGVDQPGSLHGSCVFTECNIKESARSLSHMHAHTPPTSLLISADLSSFFPFLPSLLPLTKQHTHTEKKDDNRGWDFKVSSHCYTLIGSETYTSRDKGLHHGTVSQCWSKATRGKTERNKANSNLRI